MFKSYIHSPPGGQLLPRVFPRQNSVFIITSAKILPRWLFPSKIYIQFTIFNTYFSTKLSFTNKRYHLHVLEKCLYVLQEVRSIIYFRQFIHPLSLRSCGNGTSFAFMLHIIVSAKFCDVTFLNNFYFVSFFYHLFICQHRRKISLVTLSKSYFLFSLLSIFLSYLSLLLNSYKTSKIIFKTQCLAWEKSTLHCI